MAHRTTHTHTPTTDRRSHLQTLYIYHPSASRTLHFYTPTLCLHTHTHYLYHTTAYGQAFPPPQVPSAGPSPILWLVYL